MIVKNVKASETLYAIVALGQIPMDIQFYDSCGWVRLWRDPYRMIIADVDIDDEFVPYYWNLYVWIF